MWRDLGFITAANVVYALMQWTTVVLIARFAGVEVQGHYSYVLAIATPLAMLSRLNLRAILVTDHKNVFHFAEYAHARLLWSALGALPVPIIVYVSGAKEVSWLAAGVALMKYVEGLIEIAQGQMQRDRKVYRIFLSAAYRAVAAVGIFGIAVYNSLDVALAAFATAIAWTIVAYKYEWTSVRTHLTISTKIFGPQMRSLSKQCLSMGVSMALLSMFSYVPIYFLKIHATVAELGRYAAINYLWMIGVFVATSIIQALSPRLAAAYHEMPRQYMRLLLKTILATSLAGIVLLLLVAYWGERFVVLLYGPAYAGMEDVIEMMILGLLLSAGQALLGLNLTIAREFSRILSGNAAALICILALSAWLVPEGGPLGAAQAFVLALAVKFAASAIQVGILLRRKLQS